eukprot:8612270-Pyramimonas_sp.AAC.1
MDRGWCQIILRCSCRTQGKTAHFGRLFAILVEKNSEMPLGHKDRKYKGRVVFDGLSVRDQNKDVAFFQELSSSPATMQASKAADTYGLLDGHSIEQADARQDCTQSKLGGTPTWVFLPRDERPKAWSHMRNPVCPLYFSLYGHPDPGGHWEQHCEGHVAAKAVGACRQARGGLEVTARTL